MHSTGVSLNDHCDLDLLATGLNTIRNHPPATGDQLTKRYESGNAEELSDEKEWPDENDVLAIHTDIPKTPQQHCRSPFLRNKFRNLE